MKKQLIISGGGTGGHIYPALALAEAIERIDKNVDILFVGAEGKMETQIVPRYGYPIKTLPIRGFQRGKIKANLGLPLRIISSLIRAFKIVNYYKPAAVIGTGGYASLPLLWLAQWLGIKTFIQEQNSFPGWANRLLARRAYAVCVAYPDMEKFFPAQKICYFGNPLRPTLDLTKIDKSTARAHFGWHESKPCLLVMGGSLGAKSINEAILQDLKYFLDSGFQVLWQTGKNYYRSICNSVENHPDLFICPFIDQIAYAYKLAGLVVARGGALTISELAAAAKACILVPSPNVTDDHQHKNILTLSQQKAAYLIDDHNLKKDLKVLVLKLLNDENEQKVLSDNIKTFAKPKAALDFAHLILK